MPLLPEVHAFLKACSEELPRVVRGDGLAEIRRVTEAREARFDVQAPAMWAERKVTIAGTEGGEFEAELYIPRAPLERPMGTLLFLHGGGWVMCSVASHANMCRYLSAKADVIGVNVGYRLAPEHKFPTAVDDAAAALTWVHSNIARYGGDPESIIVAGDSAGGNLAAVLAQRAARGDGIPIAAQALFYPSLGMGVRERFASWQRYGTTEFGFSAEECDWMTDLYLASVEQRTDTRFSPILSASLQGAPPALIIAAECDPLVDEGREYAKRLLQAGGLVERRCFRGTIHAFMSMAGAMPVGYKALNLAARFISENVRPGIEPRQRE